MDKTDRIIARSTGVILDSIEDIVDILESGDYDTDEAGDKIRQIDTAVVYLKQSLIIKRREGIAITQYPDRITDGTPRPVVCVETGKVYGSMKEAADDTGVNPGNLSRAVRGLLPTAGGFHWVAYIEERPEPINRKHTQPVICVETGEIYNSLKEAGEKTGINYTNISSVLRGKHKTAGGFHWERYEPPAPSERPQRDTIGRMRLPKRKTNAKPVRCVETDTVYESAAAAERATGVKRNLITQVTNGITKTAGGYHWEKVEP